MLAPLPTLSFKVLAARLLRGQRGDPSWWLLGLDTTEHMGLLPQCLYIAGAEFTAGRMCSSWEGSQIGSGSVPANGLVPKIFVKQV